MSAPNVWVGLLGIGSVCKVCVNTLFENI